MRILIAPDSFKDALPADRVAAALAEGARLAAPAADLVRFPLADGGEGTFDILALHLQSRIVPAEVADPLGRPVQRLGWPLLQPEDKARDEKRHMAHQLAKQLTRQVPKHRKVA